MNRLKILCMFGIIIPGIVLCAVACGSSPGISISDHNNVVPYDLIASLDYDTNSAPPTTVNLTITSYRNRLDNCFVEWGMFQHGDELVGAHGSHTYTESGQYALWVFQEIDEDNYLYDYAEVRIGVRAEPYNDSVQGSIEIFDREAYVFFSNPEQYRELDGGLADVPQIAAFLAAENLTSGADWIYGARLLVYLPEGMTIEQAMEEWPAEYPGLVDYLEPLPLDETFSEHQSNPMEDIMF